MASGVPVETRNEAAADIGVNQPALGRERVSGPACVIGAGKGDIRLRPFAEHMFDNDQTTARCHIGLWQVGRQGDGGAVMYRFVDDETTPSGVGAERHERLGVVVA